MTLQSSPTSTVTPSVRHLSSEAATDPSAWPPHNGTYDWGLSTHDVYKEAADKSEEFSPTFAEARRRLDYSYHHRLIWNRQLLQDAILQRILAGSADTDTSTSGLQPASSRRPWICFTAGPMGVGKGYVLTQLHKRNYFPNLEEYVKIDPDMIKQELPEMAGFLQADRATAATKLHRESTHMSDVVLEHALAAHRHILVDGSLRDVDFYTQFLHRIRTQFPAYRIAIVHVTAADEVIFQRAAARAEKTGRAVPTQLLQASIEQVPQSVARLSPLADAVHVIANNEGKPLELVSSRVSCNKEDINKPTWQDFQASWGDDEAANSAEEKEDLLPTVEKEDGEAEESLIVDMQEAFYCEKSQAIASALWKAAYPRFCPRCALSCDGQCGVCIHGKHLCACRQCNACATHCT